MSIFRAVGLLDDIRPNETVALLPDWERVSGIPDDCSQKASTISERIAALLTKVVLRVEPERRDIRGGGGNLRGHGHGGGA